MIICRDEVAARKRFGISGEGIGICYTRTGCRFFADSGLECRFLARVHAAVTAARLWEDLASDWLCLDCELMPWSAKAQELLKQQYAPTVAAARAALLQAVAALESAMHLNPQIAGLVTEYKQRLDMATRYVEAYRRYCWSVNSLDDLRLAPFHLLASEGCVHVDKEHLWHMDGVGVGGP